MHNTKRTEIAAHALRVFAGSGFGDAAVEAAERISLLDSVELYHHARDHRSYMLSQVFGAAAQATADWIKRLVAERKRRQHARATFAALRGLDGRVLRDLGLHRSELLSVAAEVGGYADATRARLAAPGLSRRHSS
ncbi:MAG TPA: DUF1127 domain-containing protein [Burkholderiaceae bacterium]|nr:DUF1127 domain-containing protein [Burkholderiaceae bacterium]